MQSRTRLLAVLCAAIIATVGWHQTAAACGDGGGDALAELVAIGFAVEAPVVAFGASDLVIAARHRDPTFGYGVAEAMLTAPALAVNSVLAIAYFADGNVDASGVWLAGIAVALPAYTFSHGVKSAIAAKRRRRRRLEYRNELHTPRGALVAPRSTTAAFAESSSRRASWELAAVPVTDGNAVGAGVGVLGRF